MRSARRGTRGLAATALAAALAACGGDGAPGGTAGREGSPRSVLLVTVDTIRADHVGAYGYPLDVTPVLDALAARGVLFENVYAPMPQTLPSHATIMTGLDPRLHGALENAQQLDPRVDTLAEMLKARGYATGAVVGALALDAGTGIDQGFDRFDQPDPQWRLSLPSPAEREAGEVTDVALEWASGLDGSQPFLLWVHYYDPHHDFVAPRRHQRALPPPRVRDEVLLPREADFDRDKATGEELAAFWHGYASEVRYTDAEIGRLLEGLERNGLLDETVIAVVGDHGEGLYEHGLPGHGTHVWEELHRVPFVLVHPDGEHAGVRLAGRVVLRDVVPTLLHLALGIAGDERGTDRGLDLWSLLEAGRDVPARPVILERPHFSGERQRRRGDRRLANGDMTAVLMEQDKLVRLPNGVERLYDLASDPAEKVDLSADEPERVARLAELLDAWLGAHEVAPPGEQDELSEDRLQALQALGYIGEDG